MEQIKDREALIKKAKKDGSDDAKAFIEREKENEFASLREMKVVIK